MASVRRPTKEPASHFILNIMLDGARPGRPAAADRGAGFPSRKMKGPPPHRRRGRSGLLVVRGLGLKTVETWPWAVGVVDGLAPTGPPGHSGIDGYPCSFPLRLLMKPAKRISDGDAPDPRAWQLRRMRMAPVSRGPAVPPSRGCHRSIPMRHRGAGDMRGLLLRA